MVAKKGIEWGRHLARDQLKEGERGRSGPGCRPTRGAAVDGVPTASIG
jgi:hypothetical protein